MRKLKKQQKTLLRKSKNNHSGQSGAGTSRSLRFFFALTKYRAALIINKVCKMGQEVEKWPYRCVFRRLKDRLISCFI